MKCSSYRRIIIYIESIETGRRSNRILSREGEGFVCILITDYTLMIRNSRKLNCSSKNIECQWVSIKQKHSKLILVGNLYRPPQGDMENLIQYLENVFDSIEIEII